MEARECMGGERKERNVSYPSSTLQGRKKPRSNCPGQVNFDLGQVKIEVWWPSGIRLSSLTSLSVSSVSLVF